MTDEPGKAELHHLRLRVDELEASNQALWAWVKTLASQDNMLLTVIASQRPGTPPEWAKIRDEAIGQIIDNNRSINKLPVPEADE